MNLKPITETKPAPPFQVLDIETMNWTKFIDLGFYDGEKYLEFRTLKDFLTFIKKQKTGLNTFAHFGGKFDFLFILKELLKDETFKIETIIPRGSSILGLTIQFGDIRHNLRDSSALLPFSLKSLGENFGTASTKKEWDHSKTRGYSKKLSEYLRADCFTLYESLEKFFNWPLIVKSGPAYTMASQALKVFRTFLKEEIPSLPKQASEFCRRAYLGGRTEIFKPYFKNGELFEYDVNSLYPFVMVNNPYPTDNGYRTYSRNRSRLGIYHCRVVAPDSIYLPVLGVLRDSKYIFPVGTFEGYWTGAEIDYAESKGYSVTVLSGHEFRESKNLFRGYVEALYSIRETSPKNSVSNVLAKLLMNSLYGRFGMQLERENISFEMKEGNKDYETLTLGKRKIQIFKEPMEIDSFSHVAIAAHVTSYARIHMHRLMDAQREHVYYTDTDSIFTDQKMDEGNALGELKLEHTYSSAVFLLPKTYIAKSSAKTKIAMKGFDKRKIQNFTFDDFQTALEGDLRRMKVENEPKFATLKSAIAQKKIVTMLKGSTKQLRSMYSKREIISAGQDTKPITLKE